MDARTQVIVGLAIAKPRKRGRRKPKRRRKGARRAVAQPGPPRGCCQESPFPGLNCCDFNDCGWFKCDDAVMARSGATPTGKCVWPGPDWPRLSCCDTSDGGWFECGKSGSFMGRGRRAMDARTQLAVARAVSKRRKRQPPLLAATPTGTTSRSCRRDCRRLYPKGVTRVRCYNDCAEW